MFIIQLQVVNLLYNCFNENLIYIILPPPHRNRKENIFTFLFVSGSSGTEMDLCLKSVKSVLSVNK